MVTLRCKCKKVGARRKKGKKKRKSCKYGRYRSGKKKGRCKPKRK